MKIKLTFFALLSLFVCFDTLAQRLPKFGTPKNSSEFNSYRKNDIRFNLLGLALGYPELGFELNMQNNDALGLSALLVIKDDRDIGGALIPYYRKYFSSKTGKNVGVFLEGAISVAFMETYLTGETHSAYYNTMPSGSTRMGLGAGLSIGGKTFLSERLFGELSIGGIQYFANYTKLKPRMGITVGRTF